MASPFIDNLVQSGVFGDTYIFGANTINAFHATLNRSAVIKDAPKFFDPTTLGIPWTVLLPGYTRVNVLPASNLPATSARWARFHHDLSVVERPKHGERISPNRHRRELD